MACTIPIRDMSLYIRRCNFTILLQHSSQNGGTTIGTLASEVRERGAHDTLRQCVTGNLTAQLGGIGGSYLDWGTFSQRLFSQAPSKLHVLKVTRCTVVCVYPTRAFINEFHFTIC